MPDFWNEASRALADIRSKLLTGWFGRDPDTPRAGDLGWSLESEEASRDPDEPGSFMDWLHANHPEHFAPEPDTYGREPDRGIDR